MDNRLKRLVKGFGLPQGVAEKLVEAGHDTPRKIKAVSDSALRLIPGVGKATVDSIRGTRGLSLPKG